MSPSHGRDRAAAPRAAWGNWPRKGRLRPTLAALGVSVAAALGLAAPAAHAGTYVVRTCDPNSGIGSMSGWSPLTSGAGAYSNNNCHAPGGGFQSSVAGDPNTQAGWLFNAPANTDIAGFSLYRSFTLPANQAYGTGVYTLDTAGSGSGYFNTYVNYGGNYTAAAWESASGMTGQTVLHARVSCGGGGVCTGGSSLFVSSVSITLRDSINPVIAAPSGSLLAGGPMRGTKAISYSATDQGGGVYRAILSVDGAPKANNVVDSNGGACNTSAFTQTMPCRPSVSDTISLDTTALSEGTHSVQLVVRDATDTNQAIHGPFDITVDNIPAPVNTSIPLITGIARHGQTIQGDTGTWTGPSITYARQWQRHNASTGTWTSIPGATNATYAVQPDDQGKALRMRSRATNSEGAVDAYSDAFGPIASPTDPEGDLDGDGIINRDDPDIDGDGVPNDGDADPKDPGVGVPPGDPGTGTPAPGDGFNGGGASAGGDNSGGGGRSGAGGSGGGVRIETQNGQGPIATASLAAAFEGTKSSVLKVKWGAKRKISGSLLGRDGQPVVGAKLDVHETPELMGSTAKALGQVITDAKGRFTYKLPAGVSRTIRFAYKRFLEASTYAHTTAVSVQVTPKVTIKANRKSLRNKQAVTFNGKIAGAPAGVRKIVEFQALDGKKWRTFASTRVANKNGTFKYRYRFTRTARATNYQFRAIVRAEKGWPFVTGQTSALKVKVRP